MTPLVYVCLCRGGISFASLMSSWLDCELLWWLCNFCTNQIERRRNRNQTCVFSSVVEGIIVVWQLVALWLKYADSRRTEWHVTYSYNEPNTNTPLMSSGECHKSLPRLFCAPHWPYPSHLVDLALIAWGGAPSDPVWTTVVMVTN